MCESSLKLNKLLLEKVAALGSGSGHTELASDSYKNIFANCRPWTTWWKVATRS